MPVCSYRLSSPPPDGLPFGRITYRASNTTLPRRRFLWRHYNSKLATEDSTGCNAHPHVVDQPFLTSWNNRQAPHYNVGFSPIFRSQLLDERIRPDIAGSKKINLQQLISDMEDAGSVDLRGDRVLPWLLRVIRTRPLKNADLRGAVKALAAWKRTGAHRRDLDQNGHYDNAKAARIMDAWWPRLVKADFQPALGTQLYDRVAGKLADDATRTSHLGSAFDTSAYGIVQKDLRDLLGAPVRGPYSRVYCGHGKLGKCRASLLSSLSVALKHDGNSELYPAGPCQLGTDKHSADASECSDAIRYRAVGAISQPLMPWINRPTFQQAVHVK